ncbi:MAG: hypothetical protein D3916_07125 [Candidatus Electrothrix sp. MAN1_4]|nr:hypothetical protein [Candidatus Electrothrix sp. MAN1_4]
MNKLISKNILLNDKKQPVLYLCSTILLVFIILRWFFLIDEYSINMLYWDQWDFLEAFFADKGLWELFSWQHGPHRQGVGFFLTKMVADLSGWNTRVESFVIGAVVCLAALTALVLKLRITQRLSPFDVFIPLIYLTPLQFGLFANTPNVSHGAMPLLLITLFCLGWLIKNLVLRYTVCAVINFMTIYTGFGFFLGCITPILFLSELYLAWKRKRTRDLVLALTFFLVALASMLSYFIDYTFHPAANGFVFPHPYPFMYIQYILITFASFCGIRGSNIVLYFVGAPVVGFMLYLIVQAGMNIIHYPAEVSKKRNDKPSTANIAIDQIILVLITFTLVFTLNLSVGRVCLGLGSATSSRYQTYLIPVFFALYLFAVTRRKVPLRGIAFCLLCFFVTTFSVGTNATTYFQDIYHGKQRWKEAYLQTEDIYLSNRLSKFAIHPNPSHTELKRKLDYLKEHRLNLYLDKPEN